MKQPVTTAADDYDTSPFLASKPLPPKDELMRRRTKPADQRAFIDDVRDRQKNILWPDTMRNARSVDEYLWKGSENAPLVQRIGAWLFGLSLIGLGLELLIRFRQHWDWYSTLYAFAAISLGIRTFLNGFKWPKRKIKTQ